MNIPVEYTVSSKETNYCLRVFYGTHYLFTFTFD